MTDNSKNHKYFTRSKTKSVRRRYDSSSNDDSSSSEEEEFSKSSYHKLLADIFPSNFSREKAETSSKLEKVVKKQKISNKLDKDMKPNFNIILAINPKDYLNISERDSEYNTDHEINYDSDDEYYDEDNEDEYDEDDEYDDKDNENENENEENIIIQNNRENNEEVLNKFKNLAQELKRTNSHNKFLNEFIQETKSKESKLHKNLNKNIKKEKANNNRIFKRLLHDRNTTGDMEFFNKKLNPQEQKDVIIELERIKNVFNVDKPYLMKLIDSDIPLPFKAVAFNKINTLRQMALDNSTSEYYKMKNWVDAFMKIPFNKFNSLPISINDGVESSHNFIQNAKEILDNAVYGLNDAKLQIMQLIGQWITNPNAIGTAIAIRGPMGTGKTSLVKEGISKILNRPFAFIALGGAQDSSFLEGHSYTYEGSIYGKIADILIQCKSMNPIIMFDELDKVSDTPKGEEIIGILTHLTDPAQNKEFHDKYFSEIDFDLSKCLFIFSYNDDSKINPILKDRMYRIETKGYKKDEKIIIANKYLLPTIKKLVNFENDEIIMSDEALGYMIEKFTDKEDGVRNLKRCLEILYTKLNLLRLMKPGENLFEEDLKIKVNFPITITNEIVDKLIKLTEEKGPPMGMYL